MQLINRSRAAFDRFQRNHPFVGFPLAVLKKYGDDEAGHQAALLAYYGFLALFPLLLVLTTIVKLLLRGEGSLQHKILEGATTYIPVIGSQLGQNVHSLHSAGLALAVGIILTIYGARGIADVFRGAVNHVWEVPYVKRTSFPKSLFKSLAIIIFGGLGLLATPIIAGYAVSFGHNWLSRLIALLVTLLLLFLLSVFLARTAMSQPRPLADLWVGGLVAAIGLMVLQGFGTYLITHQLKHLKDLYSTFAIVLGLLYWLYLQTQLLLYAMEIDSVRAMKLWPRGLDAADLTDGDREAYRLYAHRSNRLAGQRIEVYQPEPTKKRPLLERIVKLAEDSQHRSDRD